MICIKFLTNEQTEKMSYSDLIRYGLDNKLAYWSKMRNGILFYNCVKHEFTFTDLSGNKFQIKECKNCFLRYVIIK